MIRILTALFLLTVTCFGATNVVTDLSYTNVLAQINAATAGDTIILTNGAVGWTNTLTITNGITISAMTQGETIITNIQNSTTAYVFTYNPSLSNLVCRISGIFFELMKQSGGIYIYDGSQDAAQIRIDHCTFNRANIRGIYVNGVVWGVADHNTFANCEKCNDVYFSLAKQDWSWEQPYTMGSTNAFFIEDNIIIYNGDMAGSIAGVTSGQYGGRYVFRNNVISNTAPTISLDAMDAHGNQGIPLTSSDVRGTVSFEIYSNLFYSIAGYRHFSIRGGSGLIYSNIMNAGAMEHSIFMYEEDGPARFNYVTNPPAYDPVTNLYIWSNTFGGSTAVPYVGLTSTNFIQENRDYYLYAPTGYVAAVYPHPLVGEADTNSPPDIPDEPEDPPDSGYAYSSTAFNGTNQYMANTNEFIAPTTNSFTASMWVRRLGGAGDQQRLILFRDSASRFTFYITSAGKFYVYGNNGTSATLTGTSATTLSVGTNWYHIYCSVDLTDTNSRCLVINGVKDATTWSVFTEGGVIDFTTYVYFAATHTPGEFSNVEMTEFWLDVNSGYLDWEDTLSKFASREENVPIDLGDNGELPTGTAPDLYLPLDFASPMTDASGSGNDFDVTYNGPLLGTNYNAETVTAEVTISDLAHTYDGTAKAVTVTTIPYGLTNVVTYDGSANAPTNVGSYTVVATIAHSGYQGGDTNTLVISKATPTISAWPTASSITVMQSLTNSTLTGGTASAAGTFAFTYPDTLPDPGTYTASVTFTPTDTDNYNSTNGTVNVTVSSKLNKFFKASSGTKWMVYTNGRHMIINLTE